MITCPRCGGGTPSGKFCSNCGAPLQPPAPHQPAAPPQQQAFQPPSAQYQPQAFHQPSVPYQPQAAQQPSAQYQPQAFQQPPAQYPYAPSAPQRPAWRTFAIVGVGAAILGLVGWAVYEEIGSYALFGGQSTTLGGPAARTVASPKAKPGWVIGSVTDASGAPLNVDRSQVVVQVTGDLKDGQVYKGTQPLDSNWRFSTEVPPGKYTASGFVKVQFEGTEYWLSLDPVGGRALQDSAQGVVKNLQWRLTGLRPDSDRANPYSYYGSYVFMLYQGRTLPDDAQVTFTVTPISPLADGSQGEALIFKATGQQLKKGTNLLDIPLARYQITGEVTMPDGARKKALISGATGPATSSQAFTFRPNSMGEGMEGVSLWMMGES